MSTGNALSLSDAERRTAERVDPAATAALAVSTERGGVAFTNAGQLMEFAKLMAVSSAGVRKHLRGNPGACLAIVTQAVEWGMSAYAVANKSYFVNDQIAYESQLVQAVILKRAPIKGRIKFEFSGAGHTGVCRAWARLAEDPEEIVEYVSPEFSKITPKNSPLWKSDPDQQHAYYSGRALCRRHFPDVLLGVYADDELGPETPPGPDGARDVTPAKGLTARLDALVGKPAAEQALQAADAFVDAGAATDDLAAQEAAGEGSQEADETDPSEEDEEPVDPNDADFKRGVEAKREGHTKCLVTAVRENPERFRKWKAGYDSFEAEA